MLIKQQMQLVKSRAGHLPVGFLVKIAGGNRVGQQLIQPLRHFKPDGFFQVQREHMADCPVSLDLGSSLVKSGLRSDSTLNRICGCHYSPLDCSFFTVLESKNNPAFYDQCPRPLLTRTLTSTRRFSSRLSAFALVPS